MARNRMIKPEYWEDPTMAQMSRDARLLFIGLWNYCDDLGVVPANPIFLKNKLFPYDNISIDEFTGWLKQLVDFGRIIPIVYRRTDYYSVPNFLKHQKIDRPNLKGIYVPKSTLMTLLKDFIHDENEEFDDDSTIVRRGFDYSSIYTQEQLDDNSNLSRGSFDDDSTTIRQNGGRQREKEIEIEVKEKEKEKKKESSNKFSPPSLQDVLDYFLEKKSDTGWADFICEVEAGKFINFYDSKNWYVGRNKMTKWKSAAAGWITRANEFDNGLTKNGNANKPTSTTGPKSFGTL